MSWKFWKVEEVAPVGPVELVPVLPDERLKEEQDRFNDLMQAWIVGDPPFSKTKGPDLWNRRSLGGEIEYLKDQIRELTKRVNSLEGVEPTAQAPYKREVKQHIVVNWTDHDADKAKEKVLAGSDPAKL